MTPSTLIAHLAPTGHGRAEALRVVVLHDGHTTRKRVEQLFMRISVHIPDLQVISTYQPIHELGNLELGNKAASIDLLVLAASCIATLPHKILVKFASLLPLLKNNDAAVALLSGANVPRQMEVRLVEQLLRKASERAGLAFFSGFMPGLGCPGCGRTKRKRSRKVETERLCVLHSPRHSGVERQQKGQPR